MNDWYSRPVLFVSDIDRSLRFYADVMGFDKIWHEGNGAGKVSQVGRAGCEIILCEDKARKDRGRLFVSLDKAGMTQLDGEIVKRSIPSKRSWWGYDCIQIDDPDGNELLFPLPKD